MAGFGMVPCMRVLVLLVILYPACMASHFRGGIIMWKPTGIDNQVTIDFRISWRKSFSTRTHCDSDVIAAGTYIGPSGNRMECFKGCNGIMTSMDYKCTDFSVGEDWSAGEKTFKFTFPAITDKYYQFGFSGGDWITLVNGGGSWEMRTTANLTTRSDTGTINSSPASAMPPIVRVPHGCNVTIEIPVNDDDGDEVRCRWSEAAKRECAGVCDAFPGAVLDQRSCKMFYSATGQVGWYAVAVQIEDFAKPNDTEPLSSIPLQFLVRVFESDNNCTNKPEFIEPTRIATSCVGVPFNATFFEPLIAKTGSDTISISEINTVSPVGVTKSEVAPYGYSKTEYYVNITWTPTPDQKGSHIFCFSAVDSAGLTSDRICITLLGGVKPPEIINGSQSPVGDILPTHGQWSLTFDMQYVQPTRPTYIYFYKADGKLGHKVDVATVTGYPHDSLFKTMTIDPKFRFTEKEHYYVLLDPGVARGTTYCGAESPAVRDKSFWTVRIRDITPPHLQFLHNPTITNANVTITWSFDEEVMAKCTLQTPNSVAVLHCNNTWSGLDLAEGYYTLFIQGTDLENNTAEPVRHTWRVDRTPPTVTFFETPNIISNEMSFNFTFRCNEECSTMCRLYEKGTQASFSPCGGGSSRDLKRYDTGSLATDKKYVFEVKPTDVVENEGSITVFEWQTDFVPPVIHPMAAVNVSCEEYSPNATGIPSVSDNLDKDPVVKYKDEAAGKCGIRRVWNASDNAGNTAYIDQEVMFINPRPLNVQFPADAIVPCGDLTQETTDIMLPAVKVTNPCGLPVNISYSNPREASQCGVIIQRQWSVTDECGGHLAHSQQIRILELQVPDTPQNRQKNIDLQYTLRWPVYPGSVSYRLFLWNADERKPSEPVALTSQPFFSISDPLRPGAQFHWQVEYVLSSNETLPSPHWGFQTRKYPDMAVHTITVPPVAFSGQSFEVRWTVRNVGNLTTQAYNWYDAVYISFTDDLSKARRVSTVQQRNILFPGDGYTSKATIELRDNDIGQVYVFVQTDMHQSTSDVDRSNNILKASNIIEAKLTPPPDLRVDSVTIPSSSYSDSEITVSFTVENHGPGVTAANTWYDQILWSADPVYNSSDTALKLVRRNSGLTQDEAYTTQVTVVVPRQIFGEFYILVRADVYNTVFEYTNEDNNMGVSNSIHVILSPPPDLRAVSLEVGSTYTTGEFMHITWVVDNDGQTPYKQTWFDRVILQSLDGLVTEVLYTSTFSGTLTYGDTYTKSFTYIVGPQLPTGQYNITLYVDFRQDIFEFNKKVNNIRARDITIYQALPDLTVKAAVATVSSTAEGNDLQVNWTVFNLGPGTTIEQTWRDVVLVGSDGRSSFQELMYNWNIELQESLNKNDTYQTTATLRLPMQVYGNVLVKVVADKYGKTADNNRSNNEHKIRRVDVPLRTHDLQLQHIERIGTHELYSGSTIAIKWKVINSGISIPDGTTWEEHIFLTTSPTLLTPKLAFVEIIHTASLDTNENYTTSSTFKIPDTVAGELFLHVVIDPNNRVYEGSNKDNNAKYITINIQSPPSPDFTVSNISAIVLSSQKILSVSWTVQNIGNSMKVERKWKDSVYVGKNKDKDPTAGIKDFFFLESFDVYACLQTQQTYIMSKNLLIPQNIIGDYYVHVLVDSGNNVFELNGEDNNVGKGNSVIVVSSPPTDKLSVKVHPFDLNSSASVASGKLTWIEFTVKNQGEGTTSITSWNDVIYLINIANADPETVLQNGIKVKTISHIGILGPSEMYSVNVSVTVPYDFSGDAYFYVFSQANKDDSGKAVYVSSSQFNVAIGKLPDLLPIIDKTVLEQNGGEPCTLEYNVSNTGEEIADGVRYDSVFLSDDIILDPFDRKLYTQKMMTSIDMNSTATYSISVFLPFDLETKSYFIILVVDIRNDINEFNEQNNYAQKAIDIREKVSTDIAVVEVNASSEVTCGEIMQVSWKIRNNGQRDAKGYKCDTVYISDDRHWDITDEQLGTTICDFITVAPHTSTADDKPVSLSATVPLISDDSYIAIVKTRSNILDHYLENNVGTANMSTDISVAKLNLESLVNFALNPNDEKAFRIPNVPAEETLIVTVASSNQENFNDLRIKFKNPATRFDFDVSTSDPFISNQSVVLSNTKYGDYYVFVGYSGSTSDNPKVSQVTAEAKMAKFQILNTSPVKAAPVGYLTLKFEGTLLSEDVTAKLSNANREIQSVEMFRLSSTLVWATFDMKVSSVGEVYSASLSSEYLNLTTSLTNSLEIIDGIPGRAKASLTLPAALRPGERGLVFVDIQNEGDTDMIAPVIAISTNDIGHLKHKTNLKASSYQKHHVMLASPTQGPGGILPPKAYCRLIFDAKQIDSNVTGGVLVSVSIIDPSETKEHSYIKLKDTLRFSHYDAYTWEKVWSNFISYVGTTWSTLFKKVSEIANQQSMAGRRVNELADFVAFLLDMSDGAKRDSFIIESTDISHESYEFLHVGLEIRRLISPKVGLRSKDGFLGKGWTVPLWDTKLVDISHEIAKLKFDQIDFIFMSSGFGVYENNVLGKMIIRESGCYYMDRKSGKEYQYNLTSGELLSVTSNRDGSSIRLMYDTSKRMEKIEHSSGAFIDVSFDDNNRIISASLRNSTEVKEQSVAYSYDPVRNLLVAAMINGKTTTYDYYPTDSIRSATYPDGSREIFDYSPEGYLASRTIMENGKMCGQMQYIYDGKAQVTRIVNPGDIRVTTTYNELGEVAAAHRKGSLKELFITTENTRSIYEGESVVIFERYDRIKNSIYLEDGNTDSLEVEYDRLDQVRVLKDGGGNMYSVERKENGTLKKAVFPDKTEEHYKYRADGYDVVTRNGVTKQFNYDNLGRVVWKDIGYNDITTYQFDNVGNMIEAINKEGKLSFSYDENSVLQSVHYPNMSLSYRYTEKGLKNGINSSIGYNVEYSYNDFNLLTKVRDKETGEILM